MAYVPYWQDPTGALTLQLERGELANRLEEEKLKKVQAERTMLEEVMDSMRGVMRGTGGYQPVPQIQQAMAQGGGTPEKPLSFTNQDPSGGYELNGKPLAGVQDKPNLMANPQAIDQMMQNPIMRKLLGYAEHELPQERLQRDLTVEGARAQSASKLQEKNIAGYAAHDVRLAERQAALETQREQARSDLATKADLAKQKLAIQQDYVKDKQSVRLKYVTQRGDLRKSLALMTSTDTGRKDLSQQLNSLDKEERAMLREHDDAYRLMSAGLDIALPGMRTPEEYIMADFDEKIRESGLPPAYIAAKGLNAKKIMAAAKAEGSTPEQVLEAILDMARQDKMLGRYK